MDRRSKQLGPAAWAALAAVGSRLLLIGVALVTTFTVGVRVRALYLRDPAHAELFHGLLKRLLEPWAHWDGVWFIRIAADGYQAHPHSQAFFPLYPLIVRAAAAAGVRDFVVAGLVVSLACYAGAMVVLYRLADAELGPRVALWSVVFISVFPTALFFQAVYSESLFLLLTLLAFWWARGGRWAFAGLAGLLAVLTRSAGIVLLLPMVLMWWEQRRGVAVRLPGGPAAVSPTGRSPGPATAAWPGPSAGPGGDPAAVSAAGALEVPPAGPSRGRAGRAHAGALLHPAGAYRDPARALRDPVEAPGDPVEEPMTVPAVAAVSLALASAADAGVEVAVAAWGGAPPAPAARVRCRPSRASLAWILLMPVGLGLYMLYLWLTFHDALLFDSAQAAWGRQFTPPTTAVWRGAVSAVRGLFWLVAHGVAPILGTHTASGGLQSDVVANLLEFSGFAVAVALLVACWRKLPAAYTLYAFAALLLPLLYSTAARPLYSLPRFAVVIFPLFVAMAVVLATRPVWRWVVVAALLVLLSASTVLFASFI